MPLFKQVAAQQKRAKRKAEALLSDEEDENDSGSDSDAQQDFAGSDEGESDEDSEDEDGDEDSLSQEDDEEASDEEPEELDEDEPRPPPVGFPTAKEALENTVASTAALIAEMDAEKGEDGNDEEADDEEEEEAPLVCVVCPNKILKLAKMVEVHLASKDHKRRYNRFKTHVESAEFPPDHLDADARWVASQLDKAVVARLSAQTQFGGKQAAVALAAPALDEAPTPATVPSSSSKKVKTTSTKPAQAEASPSNPKKKQAADEAAASGVSVREQLRQKWKVEKKERAKKRQQAKKAKFEANKKAKIEAGEKPDRFIPTKPRYVEKIRPTQEEIDKRQKWKAARNEARAKGLPPPPKPVLAYELGGKVPVEKPATKKAGGKAVKKAKVEGKEKGQAKAKGKGAKGTKAGKKEAAEDKELLPEV
ncbi:hypothetical protein JCM10212_006749 [Sporobolomyces blumeae]